MATFECPSPFEDGARLFITLKHQKIMSKQAKKIASEKAIKDQQHDLQFRFSRFTSEQRTAVSQYLTAYNLAAWLYNDICDEDCRTYIDLAMQYTIETQQLSVSMSNVESKEEVEQVVNQINGE